MLNKDEFVLVRSEPKLLYAIYEELVKLNESVSELCSIAKGTGEKTHICKVCGKEHPNMGKLLACLKGHKKEKEGG